MRRTLVVTLLVSSLSLADTSPLARLLLAVDTPATKSQLEAAGGAPALLGLATSKAQVTSVRRAATAALAYFSTLPVRDGLTTLTRDEDPLLRKTAVEALGFAFIDDVGVEATLVKALADAAPPVRRAAIRALGVRTTSSSLLALEQQALEDLDPETRAQLQQALAARRAVR